MDIRVHTISLGCPKNRVDTEVSSAALAEAIRQHGQKQIHYLPEVLADPARLLPLLEPGDLVLTLGAGSVGRLGEQLLALLQGVGP